MEGKEARRMINEKNYLQTKENNVKKFVSDDQNKNTNSNLCLDVTLDNKNSKASKTLNASYGILKLKKSEIFNDCEENNVNEINNAVILKESNHVSKSNYNKNEISGRLSNGYYSKYTNRTKKISSSISLSSSKASYANCRNIENKGLIEESKKIKNLKKQLETTKAGENKINNNVSKEENETFIAKNDNNNDNNNDIEKNVIVKHLSSLWLGESYKLITSHEGMYGEIRGGSINALFRILFANFYFDQFSIFLDIGSGRGVPNFLSAQYNPLASIGIEMCGEAYGHSIKHLNFFLNKENENFVNLNKNPDKEISGIRTAFCNEDASAFHNFEGCTHLYSFDICMEEPLISKLVHAFINTKTAWVWVSYRKDLITKYRMMDCKIVDCLNMQMCGSGESHKCYIYVKNDWKNIMAFAKRYLYTNIFDLADSTQLNKNGMVENQTLLSASTHDDLHDEKCSSVVLTSCRNNNICTDVSLGDFHFLNAFPCSCFQISKWLQPLQCIDIIKLALSSLNKKKTFFNEKFLKWTAADLDKRTRYNSDYKWGFSWKERKEEWNRRGKILSDIYYDVLCLKSNEDKKNSRNLDCYNDFYAFYDCTLDIYIIGGICTYVNHMNAEKEEKSARDEHQKKPKENESFSDRGLKKIEPKNKDNNLVVSNQIINKNGEKIDEVLNNENSVILLSCLSTNNNNTENRKGTKREESRKGKKSEESRKGKKSEESRKGKRIEESRKGNKSEENKNTKKDRSKNIFFSVPLTPDKKKSSISSDIKLSSNNNYNTTEALCSDDLKFTPKTRNVFKQVVKEFQSINIHKNNSKKP